MAANGVDATGASMTGAQLASLIVAAVGVIVIAGEFSTGMIRTSFVGGARADRGVPGQGDRAGRERRW